MLVLSRRVNEKIVFPNLGITVQLLRINGRTARIGVNAPDHVNICRDEVDNLAQPEPADPTHAICNRLSKVTLSLHLFERQRAAGHAEEAEATLNKVFDALAALDRDAVSKLVRGETVPTAPSVPKVDDARPVRALLVEDDPNERELLAGLLQMNGCECATASDGNEAMRYLLTNDQPDFVLLDMLMPNCDGPTALRRIRNEERLADLRVFAVSGTTPQQLGVPTGPDGLDGWFPKPINPRRLWTELVQSIDSGTARN